MNALRHVSRLKEDNKDIAVGQDWWRSSDVVMPSLQLYRLQINGKAVLEGSDYLHVTKSIYYYPYGEKGKQKPSSKLMT